MYMYLLDNSIAIQATPAAGNGSTLLLLGTSPSLGDAGPGG